ncbi:MAG: hypothetical protein ABI435_04550 [Pseudolysinimonas sp.]
MVAATVFGAVGASPAMALPTAVCGPSTAQFGCPAVSGEINGDHVDLTGTSQTPGRGHGGPSSSPTPPQPSDCLPCPRDIFTVSEPVTIADIAAFRPTPGRQLMEPDGWTIAGRETNFYAIVGTQIVNGQLLGQSADVRFTPISYHWAYGDGQAATKSTKGGTWASQRVAEFDPTPTSHVYQALGDYTITLSITFRAEYRYAGGEWIPVIGTLTLRANDLQIRVGSAKTVLVDHDCIQNAGGPGC